jgi:hypothetical protein
MTSRRPIIKGGLSKGCVAWGTQCGTIHAATLIAR